MSLFAALGAAAWGWGPVQVALPKMYRGICHCSRPLLPQSVVYLGTCAFKASNVGLHAQSMPAVEQIMMAGWRATACRSQRGRPAPQRAA